MSQFFGTGGQSIGASGSISPSSEYSGLISLQSRDSQESSPAPQLESINSSAFSLLYGPTLTSYMTTGKIRALPVWTFVDKVILLPFFTLSRFVIAFLHNFSTIWYPNYKGGWEMSYCVGNSQQS